MPLFHIVGITCTNTSFSAAFCFLRTEDAINYAWALENVGMAVERQGAGLSTAGAGVASKNKELSVGQGVDL